MLGVPNTPLVDNVNLFSSVTLNAPSFVLVLILNKLKVNIFFVVLVMLSWMIPLFVYI